MQYDTGPSGAGSVPGVCASTLKGAVLVSNTTNGLPVPVAYFPLAQDDASSWPLPQWTAEATNISWTSDTVFGLTATCTVSSSLRSVQQNCCAHHSCSVCKRAALPPLALQRGMFLGTSLLCSTAFAALQCCRHPQDIAS